MKKCLTGFFLVSIILPLFFAGASAQDVLERQVIGSAGMVSQNNTDNVELSGIMSQFMIEVVTTTGSNADLHQGFWNPTDEVVSVEDRPELAHSVSNYPNPFTNTTTISYTLQDAAYVTIKVYNVSGTLVKTLQTDIYQNGGEQTISWNGQDNNGVDVSSGSYLYEVQVRPVQMTGARGFETFVMRNVMVVNR